MTGSAGLDKCIWLRFASRVDVSRALVHAVVSWAGDSPDPIGARDSRVAWPGGVAPPGSLRVKSTAGEVPG
jgi:hypothetical protein